ncbi:hypothetical protein SAMN05192574_106343 [Mucilaginibacter gossypiicola]|uniref:Uncharacterized protein n=1 Tax=Mucilaginibacter gossypiicola TaxID=551995 RepID=A0A1H8NAU1_9SPHI|nr:hypothetical protein [Mucilaginibacter gossypiicola]SEO26811.1 hypothetical protein SAMN05192574_106343 [Mucilaginibacter gossypiicola]
MGKLVITDSNQFPEHFLFDYFYPSPGLCQDLNRNIFATIFEKDISFYSLEGLFDTTINRYFLTDIKLMEHPLLVKNIAAHCKQNNISELSLLIHNNNNKLGEFYSEALKAHGIQVTVDFHSKTVYWKNSLSRSEKVFNKKLKLAATVIAQYFILLINFMVKRVQWKGKKVILWNSFANNREKIDYAFLDKLYNEGNALVIHPNPYLLKSKTNWNKSIYWLGQYSISPGKFLAFAFSLLSFRKSFNKILAKYEPFLGSIPEAWNADVLLKTIYFFEYNLLMGSLIENLSKDPELNVSSVFRGGAAAGLIYAGVCKRKYRANHINHILVPHGTEINPIDHFSYFYLDYNILPSNKIKKNWDAILHGQYSQFMKYNYCENVNGGRIDYSFLQEQLAGNKNAGKNGSKLRIGIVLTYNSDSYQQYFINSIVESFTKSLPDTEIEFVVKPRPNLPYTPEEKLAKNPNLKIDKQDIYSFLNNIDMVIGTVSVYGVLTMVVTDGILCDIPGIYYYPNKNIPQADLGYSYHSSMNGYSFAQEPELLNFLKNYSNKQDLLKGVIALNDATKEYLVFDGNPYDYLEALMLK